MKLVHVRDYTRNKPERPLAFYQMLDKLQGKASEAELARELDRELSGISRDELEQIAGRR